MARILAKCEPCDGRGWLPNPDMDTSDPDSNDNIRCDDCDGDGFVYEEVEDED